MRRWEVSFQVHSYNICILTYVNISVRGILNKCTHVHIYTHVFNASVRAILNKCPDVYLYIHICKHIGERNHEQVPSEHQRLLRLSSVLCSERKSSCNFERKDELSSLSCELAPFLFLAICLSWLLSLACTLALSRLLSHSLSLAHERDTIARIVGAGSLFLASLFELHKWRKDALYKKGGVGFVKSLLRVIRFHSMFTSFLHKISFMAHVCACMYEWMNVFMNVQCMNACMHECMSVCMYVCMYVYIHMHITLREESFSQFTRLYL